METRGAVISLAFSSHLPCEIPKSAVRAARETQPNGKWSSPIIQIASR